MSSTPERHEPEAFEFGQSPSYSNLLAVVWRHKALVVLGLAVGVVLGALYYSRQSPVYQSSAQLIVIKKQNNPVSGDDPRAFYYDDYLAMHQVLIRSPRIIKLALENTEDVKKIRSFQGGGNPTNAIIGALTVAREGGKDASASNNILNLSYTGLDSQDCALVLDLVIKGYKRFLDDTYKNVSSEALMVLAKTTESLQKKLDEKEKAYEEFRDKNRANLVFTSSMQEGKSIHEVRLQQIQSRKLDLMVRRAELEGRLMAINAAIKVGRGREELVRQLTAKSSSGSDLRVNEQMFDLYVKEQGLLAKFGPNHADVQEIRQRRRAMENFYKGKDANKGRLSDGSDPVDWHVRTLEQELADVTVSLQALDRLLEGEQSEARNMSDFLNKEKRLRDDIARTGRLFEPIITRLQEFRMIQDLGGFDAQVITEPSPGYQIAPSSNRIFGMSGFLGLVGGLCLAWLMDFMDKSFRTPEEIRRRLGVPVLSHIPVIATDEAAVKAAVERGELDPRLCTYFQSKSFQAEAFRGLRTALYFSTQGETHKVIQVTSPQASDGKSTLIANLAVSIAQSGRKVLLIDADLRKPRLHKIFGVANTVGLASIIAQEVELNDAVQKTQVPSLFMIPCGPRPSNPAELLTSQTFKDLVDRIREMYDFVLIDTPPLLAVSDPSVVAPRVDGVVLCIRVSKNGRPNAERAKEILKTLGANVLGVVVNGAGPSQGGKYGTYGYGYNSYRYNYGYAYNYNYGYGYSYQGYSDYEEDARNGAAAAPAGPDDEPPMAEMVEPSPGRHDGPELKSGFLSRFWRRQP